MLGTRVFQLRQMLIGLVIVVFLLLRPQGLLPEEKTVSRHLRAGGGRSPLRRLLRRKTPGG